MVFGNKHLGSETEGALSESCEMLGYAWYLTRTASEHQVEPREAMHLSALSEKIKALQEQVMEYLLTGITPSSSDGWRGR